MKDLEALCVLAATKKRYWPYLDVHVKLWYVMDKLGMIDPQPTAPLSPLVP